MPRYEDEDDRPRRKRRREDDDEERPRRRRRARREEEDEEDEDFEPRPRRSIRKIDRRVYIHEDCDGETIISGNDFERVANPFAFVSQTYCAACENYAGLGRFCWADTGENIRDYRRRMRRLAPLSLKLCCFVVAPLVGAAIAAGVGYAVSDERGKGALVGAISAILLVPFFITPLLSWVWGIDYRQYR